MSAVALWIAMLLASGRVQAAPPPFDVPPVETVTESVSDPPGFVGYVGEEAGTFPYRTLWIVRRSCTDTWRYMMMSQDGVWHCLKFPAN
jgi:hypothetical protein